ncbi:MAG TPA: flagellar hook-length control protein FliK [Luteitalea sp.]|nr:flagellar hook-length control protein FliK [Luteitalea sp.]
MQITLLPPLLPTDGVTSVPTGWTSLVRGARVVGTVVRTGADGHGLLSVAGRQVPVSGGLPFPAGTRLRLEVVEAGPQPLLRLVTDSSDSPEPAQAADAAIGTVTVARGTYGLAAAVMAASGGGEVPAAAAAVAVWVPVLVARGLISPEQAAALLARLGPLPVPDAMDQAGRQALADALERRIGGGGMLLDRHMADLLRRARPLTPEALAGDLRVRIAFLARVLEGTGDDLAPARAAVAAMHDAVLGEQARSAAHLARDGALDLRLDLQVATDAEPRQLRLRFERDAPDADEAGEPEWSRVRFDIELAGLGHVQVALTRRRDGLRTEFVVERPDVADAIDAGLVDLTTSLGQAGFSQVLSRVVVDPVRACAPDVLPALPEPHAILDARA